MSAKVPFPMEPFRIKMTEPINMNTKEERIEILKEAGYNPFKIPAKHVIIDLLSDSGTGAMSQDQWAALMKGDESYANASSFERFRDTIKTITGFEHIFPVHQGRSGERIISKFLLDENTTAYSNTFFDTTKANFQLTGAETVDVPCKQYPTNPFNGNIDTEKLEHLISTNNKSCIVVLTVTNNGGGGQPVSMENIRSTANICKKYGIKLIIDACRFAENSWFIKTREESYSNRTPLEIAQEMFSHFDIAVMSAKKDAMCNIGGIVALKGGRELCEKISQEIIVTEGFLTYGGLAGRDLDAISVGLVEALNSDYLRYRINSIQEFGTILKDVGVPILEPTGGHGIYIDAARIFPELSFDVFPAWSLLCAIYVEGGIRAGEIGNVMNGVNADGTKAVWDRELLRLAVPRRLYTLSHFRYVAEILKCAMEKKHLIKGMKIVQASNTLRHFTADMCPIDDTFFRNNCEINYQCNMG